MGKNVIAECLTKSALDRAAQIYSTPDQPAKCATLVRAKIRSLCYFENFVFTTFRTALSFNVSNEKQRCNIFPSTTLDLWSDLANLELECVELKKISVVINL